MSKYKRSLILAHSLSVSLSHAHKEVFVLNNRDIVLSSRAVVYYHSKKQTKTNKQTRKLDIVGTDKHADVGEAQRG